MKEDKQINENIIEDVYKRQKLQATIFNIVLLFFSLKSMLSKEW